MGGRKRTRAAAPVRGPAPASNPATPRVVARRRAPGFVLAALALLGLGHLALRPRAARAAVPDPSAPEMLAPVRTALTSAREAVLAAPDSAAAWGEFAEVCDAHHLYPEAELAYRRAGALDPREFRWVYGLALVRDFQGAPSAEVAGLFARAVLLQPRYPPARLRQGDALVRQGLLVEARDAYRAALELDPAFALAHRNLGQTLLALDDVDGALVHLERAAALDPRDGVVSASLANALWRAGETARAEAAERDARELAPVYGVPDPVRYAVEARNRTPLACERRAREREERGEWAEARVELELLIELDPDDAAARVRLARALGELGESERAGIELERVLAERPEHLAALTQLGRLLEARGEPARAAELYRRALALAPDSSTLWKRLGACLGPLGDLAGALAAFERAGAAAPDAELLHNWGTTLARAGRTDEATQRLQEALVIWPGSAATHYNLGDALESLGRFDEAILHFERARELDAGLDAAERIAALRARR